MAKCFATLHSINKVRNTMNKSQEIYIIFEDPMHREIISRMYGNNFLVNDSKEVVPNIKNRYYKKYLNLIKRFSIFLKFLVHKISIFAFDKMHSESRRGNCSSSILFDRGPVISNLLAYNLSSMRRSKKKSKLGVLRLTSAFLWLSKHEIACIYATLMFFGRMLLYLEIKICSQLNSDVKNVNKELNYLLLI